MAVIFQQENSFTMSQLGKCLESETAESWDNDFGADDDNDDNGTFDTTEENLAIPKTIFNVQKRVKSHIEQIKEFAANIEQIKLIVATANSATRRQHAKLFADMEAMMAIASLDGEIPDVNFNRNDEVSGIEEEGYPSSLNWDDDSNTSLGFHDSSNSMLMNPGQAVLLEISNPESISSDLILHTSHTAPDLAALVDESPVDSPALSKRSRPSSMITTRSSGNATSIDPLKRHSVAKELSKVHSEPQRRQSDLITSKRRSGFFKRESLASLSNRLSDVSNSYSSLRPTRNSSKPSSPSVSSKRLSDLLVSRELRDDGSSKRHSESYAPDTKEALWRTLSLCASNSHVQNDQKDSSGYSIGTDRLPDLVSLSQQLITRASLELNTMSNATIMRSIHAPLSTIS